MIKIIGLGNRLMGDDGIALEVLNEIKNVIKLLDNDIEVIIGETDFVYCLNQINDEDIVIIVDSMCLGFERGKVTLISLEQINDCFKKTASQHQLSLINMINTYRKYLKVYIIGIEVFNVDFRLGISHEMKSIFSDICDDVLSKIQIVIKTFKVGGQYP